jgi:sugar lactone lactonase YvrE
MPGPEDVAVEVRAGVPRLLVSSLDRSDKSRNGAIYAVDVAGKEPNPVLLTIDWRGNPSRFRPHGFALLADPKRPRLFVINHGDETLAGQSIDVFDVGIRMLTLRQRIRGKALGRPNDLDVRLLPDGRYELFVGSPAQGWEQLWEAFIGPRSSSIVRLREGESGVERIGGLRFANGVAIHRNGRVYGSSSIDQRLYGYPLERGGPAVRRTSIEIDGVADNISVANDGALIVAASGSPWAFTRYADAAMKKKKELPLCPTRVWRVRPGAAQQTTLLFADCGAYINAGSSAVCIGPDLFVGQAFGDYVLRVHGACGGAPR